MDRFESTGGSFLEHDRTDVTKIAMAAFPIIKTFDVLKNIGASFVSISVSNAIYALSFQQTKEALNDGIVIAVAPSAHAALDAVRLELVPEVIARVLNTTVRMMNETTLRPPPI